LIKVTCLRLPAFSRDTRIRSSRILAAATVSLLLVSCASYHYTNPVSWIFPKPEAEELRARARQAVDDLSTSLLSLRVNSEYWPGVQETDATIEIPLLLLNRALGIEDPTLEEEGMRRILVTQDKNTGLWSNAPGSPPDVSNTGALLLTLAYLDPDLLNTDLMKKSMGWFEAHGGVEQISFFHKMILVVGGVLPPNHFPYFTPKMLAVPEGAPVTVFNIGMAREFLIPLSAWSYYTYLNRYGLTAARMSEEEFVDGYGQNFGELKEGGANRSKRFELYRNEEKRNPLQLLTRVIRRAVPGDEGFWAKQALAWIAQGQPSSGIWAGTSLTSFVAVMALVQAQKADVYDFEPWIKKGFEALARWRARLEDGQIVSQPFPGPVMDTARSLDAYYVVRHLEPAEYDEAQSSVPWLVSQQTSGEGDGQFYQNIGEPPGGWAFQIDNPYYPDHDDTAMVLLSLMQSLEGWSEDDPYYPVLRQSIADGLAWLLGRQNRNGGFSAWAENSSKLFALLSKKGVGGAPEVGDLSQTDVTARVLRTLSFVDNAVDADRVAVDVAQLEEAIQTSCRFLERKQRHVKGIPIKAWRGDWLVNYLYASSEALVALLSSGCWQPGDAKDLVDWISHSQNADGGWGESNDSLGQERFVPGPSTLVQTLFTLNGLIEYELHRREYAPQLPGMGHIIDKAIRFLLDASRGQADPREEYYTAIFIKGVWYGRYVHGPHYELLRIFGRYLELTGKTGTEN